MLSSSQSAIQDTAAHGTKISESESFQSCPTLCHPMDYTVHGILQARKLEWVAFPFSRGSSQPRDCTQVSCAAGRFFTPGLPPNHWTTREVPTNICSKKKQDEIFVLVILHPCPCLPLTPSPSPSPSSSPSSAFLVFSACLWGVCVCV